MGIKLIPNRKSIFARIFSMEAVLVLMGGAVLALLVAVIWIAIIETNERAALKDKYYGKEITVPFGESEQLGIVLDVNQKGLLEVRFPKAGIILLDKEQVKLIE
jgi:hypothetical protein